MHRRPLSALVIGAFSILASFTALYLYRVHALNISLQEDAMQPTILARPLDASDHTINRTAPTELIIYSDPECPYCKSFFEKTLPQLQSKWGSKISVTYRHFFLAKYPGGPDEGIAAECAASLGGEDAFWKYIEAMFVRTAKYGTSTDFSEEAARLGLITSDFNECMKSPSVQSRVTRDHVDGVAAGVIETPSILIRRGHHTLLVARDSFQQVDTGIEYILSLP